MQYTSYYSSPLGNLLIAADEIGLIGIWFENQKYFGNCLSGNYIPKELPIFAKTKKWLNLYFSKQNPDFSIPIHFIGTEFQKEVWQIISRIPYGQTTTYGNIARQMSNGRNTSRMSAQAVGNAIGHNPISIIVPCHRILNKRGDLTGYSAGLERKKFLLTLENIQFNG